MNEMKLAMLRMQLYTAMQQLKGDDLDEFWRLVDEIQECRVMHPARFDAAEGGTK